MAAQDSPQRQLILDTTQRLMLDEGYAAVSTRRVAKEAGLTSGLIHYYYPTTDDLLLAVYRRAHNRDLGRLAKILTTPRPVEAIWEFNLEPERSALGAELVAMANHRKAISAEVARSTENLRTIQTSALSRLLDKPRVILDGLSPASIAVLIAAIARAMTLEASHGISLGHAELKAAIEAWTRECRPEGGEGSVERGGKDRPSTRRQQKS